MYVARNKYARDIFDLPANTEKFEDTYRIVGPTEYVDENDIIVESDVADVANALTSQHPSKKPSFIS
ncbi:hypothetical protein Ahy_A05g022613 isoform B [Arachis hypogaea]|uniref:Uncharacterized protein n=1 Tax=Arachis hypogaea TaxID=3818 RepID=A0A445D156_ARAHY|nr:hypothetical protein Ahy_A05g022613 isoform B [Arachis hypogaea]